MNQLYHPARTASFFNMLAQNRDIPVFTITNNVVEDLTSFADAEKKQKTLEGVMKFLASNRWILFCCIYLLWLSDVLSRACFLLEGG